MDQNVCVRIFYLPFLQRIRVGILRSNLQTTDAHNSRLVEIIMTGAIKLHPVFHCKLDENPFSTLFKSIYFKTHEQMFKYLLYFVTIEFLLFFSGYFF